MGLNLPTEINDSFWNQIVNSDVPKIGSRATPDKFLDEISSHYGWDLSFFRAKVTLFAANKFSADTKYTITEELLYNCPASKRPLEKDSGGRSISNFTLEDWSNYRIGYEAWVAESGGMSTPSSQWQWLPSYYEFAEYFINLINKAISDHAKKENTSKTPEQPEGYHLNDHGVWVKDSQGPLEGYHLNDHGVWVEDGQDDSNRVSEDETLKNIRVSPSVSRKSIVLKNSHNSFGCYVYILLDGQVAGSADLPVYPNEFADSNRAGFSPQPILGRSVDYQIYQGSSRNVSFTLTLHEELCSPINGSTYDTIHQIVAMIESANYPGYSEGIVMVPEVIFIIGDQFKVRGIMDSCNSTWRAPIIDKRLVNCDLSISITETSGPYSQSMIAEVGGRRG